MQRISFGWTLIVWELNSSKSRGSLTEAIRNKYTWWMIANYATHWCIRAYMQSAYSQKSIYLSRADHPFSATSIKNCFSSLTGTNPLNYERTDQAQLCEIKSWPRTFLQEQSVDLDCSINFTIGPFSLCNDKKTYENFVNTLWDAADVQERNLINAPAA